VDFGDWTKMLTMVDSQTSIGVGKWAQVCRGLYKGDIGYVSAVKNWGGVSLLLVPHLQPPQPLGTSASKRKRGTAPPKPELFDPIAVRCNYSWDPVQQADSCYKCNNVVFIHELIIRSFDLHSVSLNSIYMPTNLFYLLHCSHHPHLLASKFPQPLEWTFEEGEWVFIFSSDKHGIVKVVGADTAEVELDNGEGVASILWSELHKHFTPGDFIKVTSGSLQGQTGWVDGVKDQTASIVQHMVGENDDLSNIKVSGTPVSTT